MTARIPTCLWAAALLLPLVAAPRPTLAQEESESSCISCHQSLDERLAAPVRSFPQDTHGARGLGCTACHGGDAGDPGFGAMDPAKGFVGKPATRDVPQFCGRCHSDAEFMKHYNPSMRVDQVVEYMTSVHGKRMTVQGDTNVAVCTSCHPAHSIRPPSDPLATVNPLHVAETCGACHADSALMRPYRIPTNQLAQYRESIHWYKLSEEGDLSAPTCNDCHGNHGAAPPGVSWVGNVCGQCHVVMADYFNESPHASVFTMIGLPGCVACHGNHAVREAGDELLGMQEGAVCAQCHERDVGGGVVAAAMRRAIDSLATGLDEADSLLESAERAGMEVSSARFEMREAHNALIHARAAVHTFTLDSVTQYVTEGLKVASEAHARGERALKELRFRRTGLAISAVIIILLIGGLVLKIRELEAKA